MTLDELIARESIRDTLSRYNSYGDRGMTEEFVGAFAPDAEFISDVFHWKNREEIRAWKSGSGATKDRPVKFVRHNLTTCLIELTGPDTADVRTYFFVNTDVVGPDHCGVYVDKFRKVGDRWLIARREVKMDWTSPDSAFVKSFQPA